MKVTDVSVVVVEGNYDWPLVRVDTDEGISGYGEVRDHLQGEYWADAQSPYIEPHELALNLESYLVGEDPTDVSRIVDQIREYGGGGRLGGGVSGIEVALWDIYGKYVGEPIYKLLGGSYRDEVRVYCDCHAGHPISDSAEDYKLNGETYTPTAYGEHAADVEATGFDFVKFDLDPRATEHIDGVAGVRSERLTSRGHQYLVDTVRSVREAVSGDTDIAFDCAAMRDLGRTDVIRFAKAVETYDVAYLEDLRYDDDVEGWRELTDKTTVPTLVGEDLYTTDGFQPLIANNGIRIAGPDLLTAGGILETQRIGLFTNQFDVPISLHYAGSPIGFMASVHAAAAIPDLLATEFHGVGLPWWHDVVETPENVFTDGTAPVPDTPGLGIEPNYDVIAEHAREDYGFLS